MKAIHKVILNRISVNVIPINEIDENSLLGRLNIQKSQSCVKEMLAQLLAQDSRFVCGPLSGILGEALQASLGVIGGHRFLLPREFP